MRYAGVYRKRGEMPMQVPMLRAAEERAYRAEVSEPIQCALVTRPKHQLLRYVLLVIAWLAMTLLVAIALYYTLS
jgi:hypothetical protein